MNRIENLYVVAAEECAEIQQCISKILRFGESNHHPHTPSETNVRKLLVEYYQLQAVMEELIQIRQLEDVLPGDTPKHIKIDKITKVNDWANISEAFGCINDAVITGEYSMPNYNFEPGYVMNADGKLKMTEVSLVAANDVINQIGTSLKAALEKFEIPEIKIDGESSADMYRHDSKRITKGL